MCDSELSASKTWSYKTHITRKEREQVPYGLFSLGLSSRNPSGFEFFSLKEALNRQEEESTIVTIVTDEQEKKTNPSIKSGNTGCIHKQINGSLSTKWK